MHRPGSNAALVAGALLAFTSPNVARARGGAREGPTSGYVLVGGGITGFTDSAARDAWKTGGAWGVRVGVPGRSFVAGELAYIGSMHAAKAGSFDLLRNGAELIVRLQYPSGRGGWLVEPFAFVGFGWSYLSLRNAAAGSEDTDNVGEVPFGAGVTVGFGRVLVDARFVYRATLNEDLGGAAELHNWTVNAAVGVEF